MNDEPKRGRDDMPPVPRDFHKASLSELVPIKSSKIKILKSPILYMVVLTGMITIAMFGSRHEVLTQKSLASFYNLMWATIAYLLLMVLLVIYLYSKTDKPFWAFLTNSAFVAVLLTPLGMMPYAVVFRRIIPGSDPFNLGKNPTMAEHFIAMFFGAGLMEELMKVTLVIFGAYIAVNAVDWQKRLPKTLYDWISVRGPLDGLLMGLYGGAGFILMETGAEYIPLTFERIQKESGDGFMGIAGALMLLLPRVTQGMVGHMAWAGITGYFIGLAVIRPGNALKMVGLAWVGSATLHAIWNTQGFEPMLAYLSTGVSGVLVVACLLKARQLEMSMGRTVETYGSIVVDPNHHADTGASPPGSAVQKVREPAAPNAAAGQNAQQLRLVFENLTLPISVNQTLDLSNMAELNEGEGDIRAEVSQHPTRPDVLGLKNIGTSPWTATLRDGTEQGIAPQRNIRLARGVKINFGHGLVAEVQA